MLFQFKSKPEDFIVKEELWFTPSWKGDVFCKLSKNWKNTMDIIEHLCYELKLKRNDLGIAGLKDKNGITEQRISIYKNIKSNWMRGKSFKVLWQKTIILDTTWHHEPLAIGKNAWNYFKIKLQAKSVISPEIKEKNRKQHQKNTTKLIPKLLWETKI